MILLFNGTNEDFDDMQYAGRRYSLKSGEKKDFEDPAAKHILNSFGPRGLTYLKYGDDEEIVRKQARSINEDFKKRQVTLYNVQNENRKSMGLGYSPPTPIIKKYAVELGVKLLEPYTIRDAEREGLSNANKEIEALKKDNKELKELLTKFLEQKEQPETPKGVVEETTTVVEKTTEEKKPRGNPLWKRDKT